MAELSVETNRRKTIAEADSSRTYAGTTKNQLVAK
jgi:hypothetical protein